MAKIARSVASEEVSETLVGDFTDFIADKMLTDHYIKSGFEDGQANCLAGCSGECPISVTEDACQVCICADDDSSEEEEDKDCEQNDGDDYFDQR